jgi:hypothetical protein
MLYPNQSFIRATSHTVVILLFIVSLGSGIRLAFDNPYLPDVILNLPFIPQGNQILWHELAAYGWLALVIFSLIRWVWVHFQNPTYYPRKNRFISMIYFAVLSQTITGLLLYINQWLSIMAQLNQWLLLAHYLLAGVFLLLVIIHLSEQTLVKSWPYLLDILVPRQINIKAVLALTLALSTAGALYYSHHHNHQILLAQKIPLTDEIRIDGHFDEAAWQSAPVTTIFTTQGNDYFSAVPVEIRMLHNGLSGYFAIRWPDTTASYSHLPLHKTAGGWQVKHDGFAKDDERTFYEDKMAVMLSQNPGLAGGYSVHLGKKPLADKPQNRSGRGYHYSPDSSIRDVWHFKAVRTKQMSYLDDNHFGAPSPGCEACPRYTAGYRTDPKDSGAFRANWTWFLPDTITPLRLPMHPDTQQQVTNGQFDANTISWFDTIPYSEKADTYPLGTYLPSVLNYEGFEGDRANVSAKGFYHNGYWHLELARNLKHESEFDLPLEDGIFLWFSPFDHAQSRHGYHLKPLKLVMK